jgi:hypothetical protein
MKVYCLYCEHSSLGHGPYPLVGCTLLPKKRWLHRPSYWDYGKNLTYGSARKKNKHNDCPDFQDQWGREFTLKNTNNGE